MPIDSLLLFHRWLRNGTGTGLALLEIASEEETITSRDDPQSESTWEAKGILGVDCASYARVISSDAFPSSVSL